MSKKCLDKVLRNGNSIYPIMLGSFQVKDYQTMFTMIDTAISNGCLGFDTSPSYGTEKMLGKAIREVCIRRGVDRHDIFISDKIDGWQMFEGNGEVERYVDFSLITMGLDYLDLLLVHWPFEKYLLNTWHCFERMYEKGKVKAIGLCNVNRRILERLIDQSSILPLVIQNEISPLRTCQVELDYFSEKGIVVEAYSPLCRMLPPISQSEVLSKIAEKYGKSIAQIILRWHMERGVIPIFTSTKTQHIISNLDIFDFELTDMEMNQINGLDQDFKIFPESYGCPGF